MKGTLFLLWNTEVDYWWFGDVGATKTQKTIKIDGKMNVA